MKTLVFTLMALFSLNVLATGWGIKIEKNMMTTPCNGQTVNVPGAQDCNSAKTVAQSVFNQLVTLGCLNPCGANAKPVAYNSTCTEQGGGYQINATFNCEPVSTVLNCGRPLVPMTLATIPTANPGYAECKRKCAATPNCNPRTFQCCVDMRPVDPCAAKGLFTAKFDGNGLDKRVICCSSKNAKEDILAGKKVCCEALPQP